MEEMIASPFIPLLFLYSSYTGSSCSTSHKSWSVLRF